jgi:HSP20 family protein
MTEAAANLPEKPEKPAGQRTPALGAWRPFETLRREVDHLFEDFDRDFWRTPFRNARSLFDIEPLWRRDMSLGEVPAVDWVDKGDAYETTAELPGLDDNDIEVKLANGGLTIKGEKQQEKEEKEKDYYLHERRFGAFERSFRLPEGVDADKIEATFKHGVLTLTLPKTPEARTAEKKIAVKTA